jgi:hypothetical protein
MLHQLDDVATLEPFLREIARQHHVFAEFKFHRPPEL